MPGDDSDDLNETIQNAAAGKGSGEYSASTNHELQMNEGATQPILEQHGQNDVWNNDEVECSAASTPLAIPELPAFIAHRLRQFQPARSVSPISQQQSLTSVTNRLPNGSSSKGKPDPKPICSKWITLFASPHVPPCDLFRWRILIMLFYGRGTKPPNRPATGPYNQQSGGQPNRNLDWFPSPDQPLKPTISRRYLVTH